MPVPASAPIEGYPNPGTGDRHVMVPHWAANSTNSIAAPMGMRMRLKASFDISSFSATNQVILKALQRYGMIRTDNGFSMYINGADDRWCNDDLHLLSNLTASDFEVVEMKPIYTSANVPQDASPSINSFSAGPATIAAGAQTTLSWSATGAPYYVISPGVGAVRGTSVPVATSATTTYTLAATNQFGHNSATVTVTVQ